VGRRGSGLRSPSPPTRIRCILRPACFHWLLPSCCLEFLSCFSLLLLQSTDDRPSWGIAYLVRDVSPAAGSSGVLEYSNTTRLAFVSQGMPSRVAVRDPLPHTHSLPLATHPSPHSVLVLGVRLARTPACPAPQPWSVAA
jgi:hypothetical protein